MGLKGVKVRENDIKGLISAACQANAFARKGKGSFFIEYAVSRWSKHVGHDFDGPLDLWWQENNDTINNCPICVFIRGLIKEGLINQGQVNKMRQRITSQIEKAYKEGQKPSRFSNKHLSEYVYTSGLRSALPKTKASMRGCGFAWKEKAKLINPF
jgi:TPP-dependent pyruvate/acetoin dehydrogenase alpha subunit